MSKDYKTWSTNPDDNNQADDLFNATTSPSQFLGSARDLQAEIAKLRDFTRDGIQTHVLVKNTDYQALLGQVVYAEITSDATADFTITAPVNPKNKDTFEVIFALKGTDKYKPIVDLGGGTTEDLSTFFGIRLYFEYKAGDSPQWNMSSVGRVIYDDASWDKANEDSGFKKTADTNLGDLKNVSTSGYTVGQALVVDSSGNWKPGNITSSGSVDLSNYYKKSETFSQTEANNKFALKGSIPNLSGYATESWVNNKNYLTSIANDYITTGMIKDKNITSAKLADGVLSGYATQNWVNSQNFLKSVPSTYALKSDLTTYRTIATSYSKGEVDTKIAGIDAGTGWQTIINDDHSLTNEKLYWLYLTTSSTGTYNLTLPSSPSNNDTLYVILNEKNGSGKFKIKGQINNTTDYEIKSSDYKKLLKLEYFSGSNWQLTVVMDWTKTAPVDISDLAKKDASNANVSDWQTKLKIPADTTTALSGKLNNPASGHHNVTVDSSWDLKGNSQTLTGSGTGDIPRTDAELVLKAQRALLTDSSGNNKRFVMQNTNNWVSVRYDANGVMQTNVIGDKDSLVTVDTKSSGAKITDFYVNSTKVELMSKADITTELNKKQDNISSYVQSVTWSNNKVNVMDKSGTTSSFAITDTNALHKDLSSKNYIAGIARNSYMVNDKVQNFGHGLFENEAGIMLKPWGFAPQFLPFRMEMIPANDDKKFDFLNANEVHADKDDKLTLSFIVFIEKSGWSVTKSGNPATVTDQTKSSYLHGFKITNSGNSKDWYYRVGQKDFGSLQTVNILETNLPREYKHNSTTYDRCVIVNLQCTRNTTNHRINFDFIIEHNDDTNSGSTKESLPMAVISRTGHHDLADTSFLKETSSGGATTPKSTAGYLLSSYDSGECKTPGGASFKNLTPKSSLTPNTPVKIDNNPILKIVDRVGEKRVVKTTIYIGLKYSSYHYIGSLWELRIYDTTNSNYITGKTYVERGTGGDNNQETATVELTTMFNLPGTNTTTYNIELWMTPISSSPPTFFKINYHQEIFSQEKISAGGGSSSSGSSSSSGATTLLGLSDVSGTPADGKEYALKYNSFGSGSYTLDEITASSGGVNNPDTYAFANRFLGGTTVNTYVANTWLQCKLQSGGDNGIIGANPQVKGTSMTIKDANTMSFSSGTYLVYCTHDFNNPSSSSYLACKCTNSNIPSRMLNPATSGNLSNSLALYSNYNGNVRSNLHVFTVNSGNTGDLTFWAKSSMTSGVFFNYTINFIKIG